MKQIQKSIELNEWYVKTYAIIIPILETEKDKSVSKRLATKIEKAIDEEGTYILYNPNKYGSKEIHVYNQKVTGYDNGISLRYGEWGTCYKAKTEQDTIDRELETSIARAKNASITIGILEKEQKQFKDMQKAYKKIDTDYKKACHAFTKKYGIKSDFGGLTVTYTTKRALEESTGVKISI